MHDALATALKIFTGSEARATGGHARPGAPRLNKQTVNGRRQAFAAPQQYLPAPLGYDSPT